MWKFNQKSIDILRELSKKENSGFYTIKHNHTLYSCPCGHVDSINKTNIKKINCKNCNKNIYKFCNMDTIQDYIYISKKERAICLTAIEFELSVYKGLVDVYLERIDILKIFKNSIHVNNKRLEYISPKKEIAIRNNEYGLANNILNVLMSEITNNNLINFIDNDLQILLQKYSSEILYSKDYVKAINKLMKVIDKGYLNNQYKALWIKYIGLTNVIDLNINNKDLSKLLKKDPFKIMLKEYNIPINVLKFVLTYTCNPKRLKSYQDINENLYFSILNKHKEMKLFDINKKLNNPYITNIIYSYKQIVNYFKISKENLNNLAILIKNDEYHKILDSKKELSIPEEKALSFIEKSNFANTYIPFEFDIFYKSDELIIVDQDVNKAEYERIMKTFLKYPESRNLEHFIVNNVIAIYYNELLKSPFLNLYKSILIGVIKIKNVELVNQIFETSKNDLKKSELLLIKTIKDLYNL